MFFTVSSMSTEATKDLHLLRLFAKLHGHDMNRFHSYFAEGNLVAARRLSHTLTNVAALLGAHQVANRAA
jgi:hypothetical protein